MRSSTLLITGATTAAERVAPSAVDIACTAAAPAPATAAVAALRSNGARCGASGRARDRD